MATQDDAQVIQRALEQTRAYYLMHALINLGLLALFVFVYRPEISTVVGKIQIGCIALVSFSLLSSVRKRILARKTGPMATALVAPGAIAQVTGWPRWWKPPPGQYQAFLDVVTRSGARGAVRVAKELPAVVEAIRRLSPEAQITVANLDPGIRDPGFPKRDPERL